MFLYVAACALLLLEDRGDRKMSFEMSFERHMTLPDLWLMSLFLVICWVVWFEISSSGLALVEQV